MAIVCLGICSEFHHERRESVSMYGIGLITDLHGTAHFVLVIDAL